MDAASMTNAELVDELGSLVDEVLARCSDYTSGVGDELEGFAFATKAWHVALWGSERVGGGRSIGCYRHDLERRAANRPLDDSSRGFSAFLREHPELTEPEPKPTLEFTDEEALEALHEAVGWEAKELPRSHRPGVASAWAATRVLCDRKGLASGSTKKCQPKVVAALRRLEKAGRVEQIKNYQYGERKTSDWRPLRKLTRRRAA